MLRRTVAVAAAVAAAAAVVEGRSPSPVWPPSSSCCAPVRSVHGIVRGAGKIELELRFSVQL